jgi:ribosome-associated protein
MESVNKSTQRNNLLQACRCAQVARDYRGRQSVVLDLRELTPEFDFFVITTGNSRRQMHAIAEEIDRLLTEAGSRRHGIEGYRESSWILQDYGDIVLHVFDPDCRERYALESLWADAKPVDWEAELGLPPSPDESTSEPASSPLEPDRDTDNEENSLEADSSEEE